MKIIVLGGEERSTNIVINELFKHFSIQKVIIERGIPLGEFVLRRRKSLGLSRTLGQALFRMTVVPLLNAFSRNRIRQIMATYDLDDSGDYLNASICERVDSVNGPRVKEVLKNLKPELVVVNGTRIISQGILSCCGATFINMHMGVTPKYRGVHGGYWAVANRDPEHCGVTVHIVDRGIDTGKVIYQGVISPGPEDNFCTYPFLQLGAGLPLEVRAIRDFQRGTLRTVDVPLPSKLYSHPTLAEYVRNYFRGGAR